MATLEQRLLKIKETVETKREEVSRLEGAIAEIKRDMKAKFGVSTVEDADKELARLREEEERLSGLLEEQVEELEQTLAGLEG